MTPQQKRAIDQIRDWIVPAVMMPLLCFFFYQMYVDLKGVAKDVQVIREDGATMKANDAYQIEKLNRIEMVQSENVGRISALERWKEIHDAKKTSKPHE